MYGIFTYIWGILMVNVTPLIWHTDPSWLLIKNLQDAFSGPSKLNLQQTSRKGMAGRDVVATAFTESRCGEVTTTAQGPWSSQGPDCRPGFGTKKLRPGTR